jgi:hypothetical protein
VDTTISVGLGMGCNPLGFWKGFGDGMIGIVFSFWFINSVGNPSSSCHDFD